MPGCHATTRPPTGSQTSGASPAQISTALFRSRDAVLVRNAGKGDASAFGVLLSVDGDDLVGALDGLGAGQEREVRFDHVVLKKGDHTLRAVADPEGAVDESKDDDNELKVTARCQG